jgi:hypothetical protein
MNKDERAKLIKDFDDRYDPALKDRVVRDAKLQFKALIFLQHQTCKVCRYNILKTVRAGRPFKHELLCKECKVKYDKMCSEVK